MQQKVKFIEGRQKWGELVLILQWHFVCHKNSNHVTPVMVEINMDEERKYQEKITKYEEIK